MNKELDFKKLRSSSGATQYEYYKGQVIKVGKKGRNDKCFCGSGKKFKRCCYGS